MIDVLKDIAIISCVVAIVFFMGGLICGVVVSGVASGIEKEHVLNMCGLPMIKCKFMDSKIMVDINATEFIGTAFKIGATAIYDTNNRVEGDYGFVITTEDWSIAYSYEPNLRYFWFWEIEITSR